MGSRGPKRRLSSSMKLGKSSNQVGNDPPSFRARLTSPWNQSRGTPLRYDNLGFVVREVSLSRGDVHRKLEDESLQLRRISTVEDIRNAMVTFVPWSRGFRDVPNLFR